MQRRQLTERRADEPSVFVTALAIRQFNPHSFRSGYTERNPAGAGGQSERVVVIAMGDVNFGSGPDATLLEKLKQVTIAFIDTAHLKVLPRFGLSQQQQAATAP